MGDLEFPALYFVEMLGPSTDKRDKPGFCLGVKEKRKNASFVLKFGPIVYSEIFLGLLQHNVRLARR